ncbi:conjugative transposon protein TraJ [Empedobacter brevis NBRC 14943 = ATCC 43319]|uniref:Conjugative transposon protein TraJ n=1 Tax=Empedobacter brevis NBRC 14943 = ATCC 43319 TaxID=1218108 RepID=A0A511NF41_9FLAO|nr:conjugative transposon protein TraJ [Empedobacter brevis]GEM51450.1 conjugative transposon protein TraJ [Empedobacter brevis NBRC 14943 = ATCC 43319]
MQADNLHEVLRSLYDEMMPLAADMSAVAKGLAGLGALFYVAIKVWQTISRAEPIDLYPLLRPFALGICIMFFPTLVLGTLNSVLRPVVTGTHSILESQVIDMKKLQEQKDILEYEAIVRNPETAFLISDEEFDKKLDELGWTPSDIGAMTAMYMDRTAYQIGKAFKDWFRNFLEILFQASALVIDTIRTFFLIVLSILGPIAFAISVWDGFQITLTQWLRRYISVYLWLPVSDLFSAMLARIQSLILERDIEMLAEPSFIPDSSNTIYIIFMIIGIIGYFTIPTVTSWVIQAGGAGNFMRNVTKTAETAGNIASAGVGSVTGNISGQLLK